MHQSVKGSHVSAYFFFFISIVLMLFQNYNLMYKMYLSTLWT